MIIVAQQPNYFPWLGYFEQWLRADRFVVLDDVQWLRGGWQRRARIAIEPGHKTDVHQSTSQWLTLPMHRASQADRIDTLQLDPHQNWPERHWGKIVAVYGRRPYFSTQLEPAFRPWFETLERRRFSGEVLMFREIALENFERCAEAIGLNPPRVPPILSSTLAIEATGTQRLVRICQSLGAQTYYSGIASTQYLDVSQFRAAGLKVQWQRWRHPEYEQGREPSTFLSHLSCLDALANCPASEIAASLGSF